MKVPIIWTGPSRNLWGRKLRTGDVLRVSRRDARIYKALGVATDTPDQVEAVVAAVPPAEPSDSLDTLRARYEAATGAPPDRRWGMARLRAALAGGPSYQRRDMQAE